MNLRVRLLLAGGLAPALSLIAQAQSGMYRVYRYAYDSFPAADKIFAETDGDLGYAPAAIPIPPRLGLPPRR
jgi:hypothetical protein